MIYNLCKAIKMSKKNQLLRTCILCLAFLTMIVSGIVGTISVVHNENVNAATIATPTNGHAKGKSTAYKISDDDMALPIGPGYIYMTPVASDKVVNLATIIAAQEDDIKQAYIGPGVKQTLFTPTSSQSNNGAKQHTISTYFQYARYYESLMKTQEALSYIPQTTDSLIFLARATWDGDKNNSYTHLRDSNHKVIKGEWYVYSADAGWFFYGGVFQRKTSPNPPRCKPIVYR